MGSTIPIARVRRLLGKELDKDIPDDVVYEDMGFAVDQVNHLASEDATTAQKERAILAITALNAYKRYISSKDTGSGGRFLPEASAIMLATHQDRVDLALHLIRISDSKGTKISPLIVVTDSLAET